MLKRNFVNVVQLRIWRYDHKNPKEKETRATKEEGGNGRGMGIGREGGKDGKREGKSVEDVADSEDRGSLSQEMQEDPRNQKKQINNSLCSLWRHTALLTLEFRTSDL